MKKTVIKSLVIGGVLALIAGIYLSLSFVYSDGFSYGTWINGEYCTGKTVKQVNELLVSYTPKPVIAVSDKDGNTSYIYSDDYAFSMDYSKSLKNISDRQNPFLWITNVFRKESDLIIEPEVTFDESLLADKVSKLPIYEKYNNLAEPYIRILSDENGFHLEDTTHDYLDYDKLTQSVMELAYKGGALFVSEDYFYFDKPSSEELKTLKEWEKLQSYLTTKIVYDMGAEMVPIDETVLRRFLILDGNNSFVYDESGDFLLNDEEISAYVHELCDDYDTATLPRKYVTYTGEEVMVNFELKATLLNEAKESEYLINAVHENIKEVHSPSYLREGFVKGKNDVGDTVIEVSLKEQKLYFIKEGQLILQTDVVTGNPNKGWTTPKMLCYIYAMSKDVVLRGEGYASPVKYWIPVYQGIGLHDASWQSAFGGDLYLTRGSRGCINLKNEDAAFIYENAYIGLPVIIY